MTLIHRSTTIAATIVLASAALAVTPSFAADLDHPDATQTATMAAARPLAAPPAPTSSQAATPRVRRVDGDAISGSEPDPESFDGKGLEIWWQHYQDARKKAE